MCILSPVISLFLWCLILFWFSIVYLLFLICVGFFKHLLQCWLRHHEFLYCTPMLEGLSSSFSFAGYSNVGWQLFSFKVWHTSFHAFLVFRVSVEKSAIILSCSFQYSSLVYSSYFKYNMMWGGSFLVMPFGVLNDSCTCISIAFPRFGKFTVIISLNGCSVALVWTLASSSTPKFLSLVF